MYQYKYIKYITLEFLYVSCIQQSQVCDKLLIDINLFKLAMRWSGLRKLGVLYKACDVLLTGLKVVCSRAFSF